MTELAQPLVVRRTVAFADALYEGHTTVEGVQARQAGDRSQVRLLLAQGIVPVIADADGDVVTRLRPRAVVDARMAKCNLGTTQADAPIVIGLGPGFTAGCDVHAVVETMRGHNLGRVILQGSAEPDTHVPGLVQGYGQQRVLRAPTAGLFRSCMRIGELAEAGQTVAYVTDQPVHAGISGLLRGLLHDGVPVQKGQKVGDIDPSAIVEHCATISDKALAVGGGVLEAILYLSRPSALLDPARAI